MLDKVFDLSDLGVELSLLGFRLVILGILGKITEAPRLFDLLGDLLLPDGLEEVKLGLELLKVLRILYLLESAMVTPLS